jgi:hypothetical protein
VVLLLVLTALLLLTSGLVKLHAGAHAGLGLPLLALVETLAGIALMSGMLAWRPSPHTGLTLVESALLLILVSSVQVAASLARRRRAREASEGARLVTYVKYLSRHEPPAP